MHTKIKIIGNDESGYELRTDRDFVLGTRLHTVAPKPGDELPVVPDKPFRTKLEASAAQLKWNLYLLHAWQKRSKSKQRISE